MTESGKYVQILKKPGNAVWILIAFGFIFSVPAAMAGEGLSYNLLIFASSLLLLVKSAEYLVDSSSRLARYFGIPQIIIGITVVAFGTSLPELTVSAIANLSGSAGISIGNIVGSNISNICLVLGAAAILMPIGVNREVFRFDVPFLIFVSMLLPILSMKMVFDLSGSGYVIGLVDGVIMLGLFCVFMYVQVRSAGEQHTGHRRHTKIYEKRLRRKLINCSVFIMAGLAGVIVSAGLLVDSGREIAGIFGVPEIIIGLTMIAVGTSLPELATNVVAALRKKLDLALGNILGSNVFNILMVLGVSSVIRPVSGIEESAILMDMPIMIGVTLLLVLLMKLRRSISRIDGVILILIYAAYIFYLTMRI